MTLEQWFAKYPITEHDVLDTNRECNAIIRDCSRLLRNTGDLSYIKQLNREITWEQTVFYAIAKQQH